MTTHVSLHLYYLCVCICYFHPRQCPLHTSWKWAWLIALYRWELRTAEAANFFPQIQVYWVATSCLVVRCQDLASSWIWYCVIFIDRQQSSLDPSVSISKVCRCTSMVVEELLPTWEVLVRSSSKIVTKSTISFVTPVRPHGTSRLPLDGFQWNMALSTFWKFIVKIHVLFKSNKKNGYFT